MVKEINGFEIKEFNYLGFDMRGHENSKDAKFETTCVHCSHNRKKSKEKCCSIYMDAGYYKCHHCGKEGALHKYKSKLTTTKEYKKPAPIKNITKLKENVYTWFKNRGISQKNLIKMKVQDGKEYMPQVKANRHTIQFNYYMDGELVNIKFRDGQKNFKMFKDAILTFYNIDSLVGKKEATIVEGEIDVLSLIEAEIDKNMGIVSVPNGATVTKEELKYYKNHGVLPSNLSKINMEYLDNTIEYFDHLERIYIATDNDAAGIKLRKELIRRLGADRCVVVDWGKHKDANEVLVEETKLGVKPYFEKAKPPKISAVETIEDVKDQMLHFFRHGKPIGTTTHFGNVDECWKWRKSEVNSWTGYANEGKGTVMKQFFLIKALRDGWKFAFYAPEDMPSTDFFDDLITMYVGKPVEKHLSGHMTEGEYKNAMEAIKEHFFLISFDEEYDDSGNIIQENVPNLQNIHAKFRYLVKTKGIDGVVIDPYNQVEHDYHRNEKEHQYISRFMRRIKTFALKYNVSYHLVAHQTTPDNLTDNMGYVKPNMYKIKGGGTFADKSDNVLYVWKEFRFHGDKLMKSTVEFGSQKIKKKRLVSETGSTQFEFQMYSHRLIPKDKNVNPLMDDKEVQEHIVFREEEEDFYSMSKEEAPF